MSRERGSKTNVAIILLKFLSAIPAVVTAAENVDPGDPLYLTPLIEGGEISKAMEAALAEDFYPVLSYSGLITVNSTHNSNIFFWFFPAEVQYL